MEPRIWLNVVQVGLASLRPEVNDVLGGDSGEVEALPVYLSLGGLGKDIEDKDGSGAGGPRVAENRFLLAVHGGDVRGLAQRPEFNCALVEGFLDLGATAWMK